LSMLDSVFLWQQSRTALDATELGDVT